MINMNPLSVVFILVVLYAIWWFAFWVCGVEVVPR